MDARIKLLRILAWLSAFFVICSFLMLIGFLIYHGAPVINTSLFFGNTAPLEAITGSRPVWDGIWPAFIGTLCLVGLTMAISLLPGIGCGIYLARYSEGRKKEMLSMAVDLLASVPSIVMGLFGFVLILFLRRTLAPDATTCISLAAFCLALLVMPALVVTTRSSIESLPDSLVTTGISLGFTEQQMLLHILIPAAGKGILGGIMLAMGRAAEDTAVIMLTGVVVNSGLPAGLGSKFEALPFLIFYTAAQYTDQEELLRGFGAAMVLLMLSAALLYAASKLQRTMEKHWKGAR
ncbi:MAG: ABC transporter permease subunit [Synergistaceae bacterium]|nr:ABC transporter permease subunit [Synergistaceae bacterium]